MKKGQVILEFTFTMIVIMIMIYAMVKIFQWTGTDLAERRIDHDASLANGIQEDWGACIGPSFFGSCLSNQFIPFSDGPIKQIDPYFHKPLEMNAVWSGY